MSETTPVPLTLEGASVLHQMFRFRWIAWRALSLPERERVIAEAVELLEPAEEGNGAPHPNQSALYSMVGHKGDLMMVHLRDSVEDLNRFELQLAQTDLYEFLEPTHSYLSVVELGLYESSAKHYAHFAEHGIEPYSPAWNAEVKEVSTGNLRRWRLAFIRRFPRAGISAFIQWIAAAASRPTGTPSPCATGSA